MAGKFRKDGVTSDECTLPGGQRKKGHHRLSNEQSVQRLRGKREMVYLTYLLYYLKTGEFCAWRENTFIFTLFHA